MGKETNSGESFERWTALVRNLRDYVAAVADRLKDFAPYAL